MKKEDMRVITVTLLDKYRFLRIFPNRVPNNSLHLIALRIKKAIRHVVFDMYGDTINNILHWGKLNKKGKLTSIEFSHRYFNAFLGHQNEKKRKKFSTQFINEINKIDFKPFYKKEGE